MTRRTLLIGTSALALLSGRAAADTLVPPSVRSSIDENSVDVIGGALEIGAVAVSVGPTPNGEITYPFYFRNGQMAASTRIAQLSTSGSSVTITLGSRSDRFTGTTTFVSTEGNGATLTKSGTDYTYTAADGTVVAFIENPSNYPVYGASKARAVSITMPNGEKITYSHKVSLYCPDGLENGRCNVGYAYAVRLQSIANSFGYVVKLKYDSDTLNDLNPAQTYDKWSHVSQATACIPATDGSCASGGDWPTATFTRTIDGSGNVTNSVTDPLARTTTYRTSSTGAFSVQRPNATAPTFSATFNGAYVASITKEGVTKTYSFTDSGTTRTTIVTDPNGGQRKYVSNTSTRRLGEYWDELNRKTTYTYDTSGRLSTATSPENNYVTYVYDTRGNRTSTTITPKSGSPLSPIVESATFPTTCTVSITCNKPISTTDARGAVTDYSYDNVHGGVLTVTAPAPTAGATRPQQRFEYTKLNGATGTTISPDTWLLTKLSQCRTTSSCLNTADERRTTIAFGPNGQISTVTNAIGDNSVSAVTTFGYDTKGNISSVDGPLAGSGDTRRTLYDAARQVTQVVAPDPDGAGALKSASLTYGYNTAGQVTTTQLGSSNADGSGFAAAQILTTTYDANARKQSDTLSSGSMTYAVGRFGYDALGRLQCAAQRMDPAQWASQTDACVPQITGASGPDRITKTTYNAADQVIRTTSALGTAEQADDMSVTAFTPNGKPQTLVDANGNVTTYTYDGFDRLARTTMPAPSSPGSTNANDYEALNYDANGNVTQRRLRDGLMINYGYDALNRLVLKDVPNINAEDEDVRYGYDLLSRVTQMRKNDINITNLTYDALGRKTNETGYYYSLSSQYDLAGRRTRLTWHDGFFVTYDYDVTDNMTAIRENGAASGPGVLATYAYDDLGRRGSITRGNGTFTAYGYDAAGRTASLWHNLTGGAQDVSWLYTYNPAGQIATSERNNDLYAWNGHYNIDRPYTVNGLNQLTTAGSVALGYDGRGNLTSSGAQTYYYTSENRLHSVPGQTNLYYDALGGLNYSSAVDRTTAYDGSAMVTEGPFSSTPGPIARRYVHGPGVDEPLLWYEGSGVADRRWLHADERGSVVAVTDGGGNAIAINRYDEYGIPGAGNIGRFQYTGQAWLPELGMYHYKARTYSPTLGRFLQTDPIGYGDGMNLYNYVGGDPVNATDPTGMLCTNAQKGITGKGLDGNFTPCIDNPGFEDGENTEILVTGGRLSGILPPGSLVAKTTSVRTSAYGARAPMPQKTQPPVTCNTRLPNGKTVGQVVRSAVANIGGAAGDYDIGGVGEFGAFFATVQGHGPIDFKNTMGPDPTGRLGAAGNFAYGAIASGVGYSRSFAEFGAGVYAAAKSKSNFNNPFGEDNSAAANLGNGYATNGCAR